MSSNTVSKSVGLLDLKAQYRQIADEVETAVLEVLRSGYYVLGPNVKAFEEEAAQFLNCRHAISCANGSDALYIALLALDIKPGDEVITTPFTYVATAEAITQIGAKPVFADIDLQTFNIDAESIKKNISDKTKAIIVVHLYGQSCDMQSIMSIAQEHNLKVIEDTAQAFGTKYQNQSAGCIADIGTYSFYPTKNLSCAGDGGMLSTNCDQLNERLRKIRAHGSAKRYYHDELGVNSRLDEIQAAILRIKLKYIQTWNEQRAQNAKFYDEAFANFANANFEIISPSCIEGSTHIYHQYSIRIKSKTAKSDREMRDEIKTKLQEQGIASEIYYPLSLHQQEIYKNLGYQKADLINSLTATETVLCLPIYPELTQEELSLVVETLQTLQLS